MATDVSLKVREMALTGNSAYRQNGLDRGLSLKSESLMRTKPVNHSLKILCVGHDVTLLATRCAVLTSCGYRAAFTSPAHFKARLREIHFDLVVLSLLLSDSEKNRIRTAIPPSTRVMALDCLVLPGELAAFVDKVMHSPAPSGRLS